MFSLDTAIAEWRRQMAGGGIKSPALLDELEGHLRDDFEQQRPAGMNAQEIFEAAVQQIRYAAVLETEFKNAGELNERRIMKRVLIISAGIIGVLVGMAFVMPAVAQYRHEGAMTGGEVVLLLLGIVLTLGGACAAVLNAKRRSA